MSRLRVAGLEKAELRIGGLGIQGGSTCEKGRENEDKRLGNQHSECNDSHLVHLLVQTLDTACF